MAAFWNDDGSVTSSDNEWVDTRTTRTGAVKDSEYTEIWAHSAVVDSAPVCLKRPPVLALCPRVIWTRLDFTYQVTDLVTGNPRLTRAPPSVRVAA